MRVRVGDGVTQRPHAPSLGATTRKVGHVGGAHGVGVSLGEAVTVAQCGHLSGGSNNTSGLAQPVGTAQTVGVLVSLGTGVAVGTVGVAVSGGAGVTVAQTSPQPFSHGGSGQWNALSGRQGGGVHSGGLGEGVGCGAGQPCSASLTQSTNPSIDTDPTGQERQDSGRFSQLVISALPSAMFTTRTSSATVTRPLASQSQRHSAIPGCGETRKTKPESNQIASVIRAASLALL